MKVLLLMVLLAFIGWRLSAEDWSKMDALHLGQPLYALLALLLVIANQACEWYKWKRVARPLIASVPVLRSAFFGGIGTAFLTPNGWGNFLGRMVFFRKRDRMYIVLSSFVSNVSQLLPTIIFGAIACLYSEKIPQGLALIALSAGALIFIGYFFGEYLLPKRPSANRTLRHFRLLQERLGALRLPLFFWSNVRFLVFSLQYVLLFMAFGYTDYTLLFINVWLIFLLTSFVPSLWSGKIVIRETAAIFVFTGTSVAIPDVIIVSLLIWLFNNVLPALVSSYVWLPISKRASYVVD